MLNTLKALPFMALSVAPLAHGAPYIGDLEGQISKGETVTLTGHDFGERNDSPLLFDRTTQVWDNGSASSPYAGLTDGGRIPAGDDKPYRENLEGFFSIKRSNRSSEEFSFYHATIGKNHYGDYNDAWLAAPTAVPDPSTGNFREMYMTWLLRLSFEPTSQFGSHKFIRVWDTLGGKEDEIRISWTQMHMTYQGGGPDWSDTHILPNTWVRMELYINADSGRIEAWVNGNRVHNITDFAPDGHTGIQPRLIGWDASGDVSFPDDTVDLARLYIDSSPARVELCNSPRWQGCSTRAIQMPLEWRDQEIKINLAPGRLDDLDNAYVYVVSPNGEVNDRGYPLCGDCPSAPDKIRSVERDAP